MSSKRDTQSLQEQFGGVPEEVGLESPLVSVGMSVFNCAGSVGAAIQSIINQSFSNWELILINDGSTDSTDAVCTSFSDSRIKYVRDGENRGLHHRLNQAIGFARGRYFARMDGDDISFPNRFERQIQYLMAHPDVDLIGTPVLVIDQQNRVLGVRGREMDHREISAYPWRGFPLPHPTWMGKLSWFRKFLYGAAAVRIEDQEILLRSYRGSRFAIVDEPLLAYHEIDLFSTRAARSRRSWSALLMQEFVRSGNPMFLMSGLIYGLLSIDAVYCVLRVFRKPRSAALSVPSAQLLDSWLTTIGNIESNLSSGQRNL